MVSFCHVAVVLGLVCLGKAESNHQKHEETQHALMTRLHALNSKHEKKAVVVDAEGEAFEGTTRLSTEDGMIHFEVNSEGHAEVESDNKPLTRRARKEQQMKEEHEDKPHKLLQADDAPVKSQADKLVRPDEKHNGPHPNWLVQADGKPAASTLEQLVKADEKVDRLSKGASLVQADQQANATKASAKGEKQLVRQDAKKKKGKSEAAASPEEGQVPESLAQVLVYDAVEDPDTAPPSALAEVAAIVSDTSEIGAGKQAQTASDESAASQPASEGIMRVATPLQ
jgi:hypothetical protein